MSNLPSQYPSLSLHLSDRALTPLITSSRSTQQQQSLTNLSHTALMTHEAALRLGLGSPQRIMVEHASNGPVLLHSFLSPAGTPQGTVNGQQDQNSVPGSQIGEEENGEPQVQVTGAALQHQESDAVVEGLNAPPMLLSTVIAPNADLALESRRAATRLERVGREVQAKMGAL